eukprot:4589340-Amphidinium_carterae.1
MVAVDSVQECDVMDALLEHPGPTLPTFQRVQLEVRKVGRRKVARHSLANTEHLCTGVFASVGTIQMVQQFTYGGLRKNEEIANEGTGHNGHKQNEQEDDHRANMIARRSGRKWNICRHLFVPGWPCNFWCFARVWKWLETVASQLNDSETTPQGSICCP